MKNCLESISASFIDIILQFDNFSGIFFIIFYTDHISEPCRIVTSVCVCISHYLMTSDMHHVI